MKAIDTTEAEASTFAQLAIGLKHAIDLIHSRDGLPDYIFAGHSLARCSEILQLVNSSAGRARAVQLYQHVVNWACAHQRWQACSARRARGGRGGRQALKREAELNYARSYLDALGGP